MQSSRTLVWHLCSVIWCGPGLSAGPYRASYWWSGPRSGMSRDCCALLPPVSRVEAGWDPVGGTRTARSPPHISWSVTSIFGLVDDRSLPQLHLILSLSEGGGAYAVSPAALMGPGCTHSTGSPLVPRHRTWAGISCEAERVSNKRRKVGEALYICFRCVRGGRAY